VFSFLLRLCFWEIFEGVPKHSVILIFRGFPPSKTWTPDSFVFSHKCDRCDYRPHLVSAPCLWAHGSPASQMARNHARHGAGPGPVQGTSGAPRAQALLERLVVLPTTAWGKGYRAQLHPLLRVRRMYQCFNMLLNERCFMNVGY